MNHRCRAATSTILVIALGGVGGGAKMLCRRGEGIKGNGVPCRLENVGKVEDA